MTSDIRFVVHGADGNDYEVSADHFVIEEGGVLTFEDHRDVLLISYSPSFWQYFSRVKADAE